MGTGAANRERFLACVHDFPPLASSLLLQNSFKGAEKSPKIMVIKSTTGVNWVGGVGDGWWCWGKGWLDFGFLFCLNQLTYAFSCGLKTRTSVLEWTRFLHYTSLVLRCTPVCIAQSKEWEGIWSWRADAFSVWLHSCLLSHLGEKWKALLDFPAAVFFPKNLLYVALTGNMYMFFYNNNKLFNFFSCRYVVMFQLWAPIVSCT